MGSEYLVPSIQERDLIYLIVFDFCCFDVFLLCMVCVMYCILLYKIDAYRIVQTGWLGLLAGWLTGWSADWLIG